MIHDHSGRLAGVWLDHQKAVIIANDAVGGSNDFDIKEQVPAPADFASHSELHNHNAKHADLRSYFKDVSQHIKDYDGLFIFGTGMAQEQFQNFLKGDSHFQDKQVTIENSRHLTDHQMVARVRDYFNVSSMNSGYIYCKILTYI